ncbi:Adenylate and Guanylate cyclase catalytic domain containing protein [Trichomonas vaginalis G3]|uniref:Adenylate and Guanylate cyclase catalytic domain containing protein n=1 Tax=Trichomonas vaginalis (strain ATCC PRA-98 / G3) TaxID=412133 RepID=A2FVN7_TRIV3|nr:Adenylate and Guanylate cyclase catalytic domain containing protein [Trichomonas vaginalis G3]|eukprot:XP_001303958.1 Adenylate and Guanylate cyclase catalytic domain containing protein [Trichomonas vaginalis G3]
MHEPSFPAWFLSFIAVFNLFQVLSIGFWIYAPPFERSTGRWHTLYETLIKIFTFQDPLDYEGKHIVNVYICLAVSLCSLIWIYLMIFYNNKKYIIPTLLLYISSIVTDLICPSFITPATYVLCHGITGMSFNYDTVFLAEIIVGFISYCLFLFTFVSSILLKSRSVVLTNLPFPLFDSSPITIWTIMTSFGCILSALIKFFDDWFYVVLGVVHLLATLYVCYRLSFIPFYEVWRNSTCLAIGITTCALDCNFFVLYAVPSLTYNYTIFVFLIVLCIAYILTTIYFIKKVAKIKQQLTYQEDVTSASEYLSTLGIERSSHRAMMYIVVGLARLGDYFVDGSLTDYIINNDSLEATMSMLLQVVTFFPSESRKMDVLFKKLLMKRKLSYADRFLVYQVYRIKTRRLVSDTKDTLEMFNKLKQKNDDCKSMIRGLWDQPNIDVGFLSSLSMILNDVNAYFKFAISTNPNNLRITNEYANFLAECMTDFDRAIVQSIRAEYIGNGKNFNVDISFRSVVNKFPRYLKDNILDTKGRRVIKRHQGNDDRSQASSSNGSNSSGMSSSFESTNSVDFEHQEIVCKRMLRDAKVRLAFHQGINGMRPIQSTLIIGAATILIVTCLSINIGFYAFFMNKIEWRRTSWSDIRVSAYSLFFTYYADFLTVLKWAKNVGKYDDSTAILGDVSIDNGTTAPVVSESLSYPGKINYAVNFSRNSLKTLLDSFAVLAESNNIYTIATNLLQQTSELKVCTEGAPTQILSASVKDQIITLNYFQEQFAGDFSMNTSIPNLYKTNEWCQVYLSTIIMSENSAIAMKSILEYNINTANSYTKLFKIWMIVGAICLFFFSAAPALIIINTYNFMINKTLKMLVALPQAVKEDSKRPLVLDSQNEEQSHNNKVKQSHAMNNIAKCFFALLFSIIIIFCVMVWKAWTLNNKISTMYAWYYYSAERVLAAIQTGHNVVHLILLGNGSIEQNITTIPELRNRCVEDLDLLIQTNNILVNGNSDVKSIIGYDKAYDAAQLEESCKLPHDPKSVHDMYACAGLESQITIFKNMVNDILNNPTKYKGSINDEVSGNVAHILQWHFFSKVIQGTIRMRDILENNYVSGTRLVTILLIVNVILSCIIEAMPWLFRYFVNENYKVLLMYFKHISPQTIIDTPEIMNVFMRNKKSNKEERMTISKSIVMDASECIIITNQSAVIQIINPSVQNNLDITPDQMLGQHIANFVADKDQQRLNQQIDLMMSGQGSNYWQDHIELVSETAELIPFAITMIGMKDREDSNEISSILFIFTNETDEIKKRKDAEEAKAKSEKLLYQILPKDIVVRLNRGETDISFTIPASTIFFIDIVKFSAYAASLTPTEIMANLSLVFATFDKIVAEYESITKIKLIGDVYMAAAGLFQDPNEQSNKHAEDAVRCCLQCAKSMEEINMKLNASLEVRIGVNSGGPLIGGVLGTDKPTFDIIGDTINVAARLQSTDIPGNVQISGNTKELIQDLDFVIEERGSIYLKGKGNQLTYFVSLKQKSEFEGSFSLATNNQ